MKIPRELPQPMFVRPNDYITIQGADYIVKRNEFGQMVKVLGRVARKLPAEKEIIWALKARRPVAYWGSKYFMYEYIDQEIIDPIKEAIWEADRRRGVPIPEKKTDEDSLYDL
jgi:hypothetical protein